MTARIPWPAAAAVVVRVKVCNACWREKPLAEFGLTKDRSHRYARCRECVARYGVSKGAAEFNLRALKPVCEMDGQRNDTHPRCRVCLIAVGERHWETDLVDGLCGTCSRERRTRR